MSIKVFFNTKQTANPTRSISPSAGKPSQAVDSWIASYAGEIEIVGDFAPLTIAEFALAHDAASQGVAQGRRWTHDRDRRHTSPRGGAQGRLNPNKIVPPGRAPAAAPVSLTGRPGPFARTGPTPNPNPIRGSSTPLGDRPLSGPASGAGPSVAFQPPRRKETDYEPPNGNPAGE